MEIRMLHLDVEMKVDGYKDIMYAMRKILGEKKIRAAIADAANRAAQGIGTDAKRMIKERWGLKPAYVMERFKVNKATAGQTHIEATAVFHGKPIPLIDLAPTPSSVTSKRPKSGIKVKGLGNVRFKHAFIAEMGSGHKGVFQRRTRKGPRLPINEMFSLSLPQMIYDKKGGGEIRETLRKNSGERFETRFLQQIERMRQERGE
jgi:hypothetical protein